MGKSKPKPAVDASVSEEFVQLLAAEQFRLHRYIYVLLGNPDAASNVLQDTNIAIWRKANQFEMGTNFPAWAKKVAYWEVQAYLRDRKRDRHVFNGKLIEQLVERENEASPQEVEVRLALRHCLQDVSKPNRELLRMRYEEGLPVASLAQQVGKTQSAVKVGLMRIRRALSTCIQRKISDAEGC